jgi:hypothetical protein
MGFITTQELDSIARLGLTDLRAIFAGEETDGTRDRADMALKLLRIGSGRFSAETNRMALAFRIAKACDVPADQVAPLWRQLAPAGGEAVEDGRKLPAEG